MRSFWEKMNLQMGHGRFVWSMRQRYPDKIRLFLHSRDNNIAVGGRPTGRFNSLYNLFSAKGKYIALCEGDDYWSFPNKLQKQVNFLEKNPVYSMSFSDCAIINAENKIIAKNKLEEKNRKDFSSEELMSGVMLPSFDSPM